MAIEVEIRFVVKEPEQCRLRLREVSRLVGTKDQVDEYFEHPCRTFIGKNFKEYLRVRTTDGKASLEYHQCIIEENRKSHTIEKESEIRDPATIKQILLDLGFKTSVIIKKRRETFETDKFIICLDEVKGLGNFLEIEAKKLFGSIEETKKECEKFAKILNPTLEKPPEGGYPDLLARKMKKF